MTEVEYIAVKITLTVMVFSGKYATVAAATITSISIEFAIKPPLAQSLIRGLSAADQTPKTSSYSSHSIVNGQSFGFVVVTVIDF